MRITGKYKDPLTRQANKAVRISQRNKNIGELLNSKSELNLGRITVEKQNFVTKDKLKNKPLNHSNSALKCPIVSIGEYLFLLVQKQKHKMTTTVTKHNHMISLIFYNLLIRLYRKCILKECIIDTCMI